MSNDNNNNKKEKMQIHDKETHGRSEDIDENTSLEKVKAPNLIERAKEEVEALVGAIHHPKHHHHHQSKEEEAANVKKSDKNGKEEKMKMHKKETHGTSGDIDEDTPISKVKGPNIFERAKEEIEAIVEAIHPHKGSDH
ncbi:hypothetical protein LUZ63_004350 [Rhynchospora breviuscula]|uniref:Uncharacterized protein n=1 Tax=Rhynchospora breviuscula TaxID=2022672 RepID=A0A9Q0D2E4_9POAL|nr:hypothetical protein LUZ63_004350 [Rhynchospora breviuscula]